MRKAMLDVLISVALVAVGMAIGWIVNNEPCPDTPYYLVDYDFEGAMDRLRFERDSLKAVDSMLQEDVITVILSSTLPYSF